MNRPARYGGIAGTMAVVVAMMAAKAKIGDEPVRLAPLGGSPLAARATTTTPPTTPLPTAPPVTAPGQPTPVTVATTLVTTPAPVTGVRTITGDSITTGYGPMQVAITIDGTRILDVQTIEYPDDDQESIEINRDALPQLRAQVLAAQSSDIQGVSGATYTAQGYALSVQSALDRA